MMEHYQLGSHDHSNQHERSIECSRFDLPDDNDDMFTVRIFCSDTAMATFLQNVVLAAIKDRSETHERCNGIVQQRLADGPKAGEHAGLQRNGRNVNPQEYNGLV